jgi:hypothetical protein
VAFALTSQGAGESVANGAVLVANQEVDVSDFVTFAN